MLYQYNRRILHLCVTSPTLHPPVCVGVFQGPQVSVTVPSLDLGLMQLGDQTQATMVLTNTTHLEAFWSLGPEKAERTDSLESGKAERTYSHHTQVNTLTSELKVS